MDDENFINVSTLTKTVQCSHKICIYNRSFSMCLHINGFMTDMCSLNTSRVHVEREIISACDVFEI